MKPSLLLRVNALALAALVAVPALGQDQTGPPTVERRAALSYLVRQDCGSCHGMTLRGGLGRALRPENLAGATSEGLAQIILDGIPGTPMPPWRGLVSEAEALWIARALREGRI